MNTRILIVDDHPTLRRGLCQVIGQQPHLAVVGEAPTGTEALKLATELSPDLIVMDIHLPDMNGIEATRQIVKLLPSCKVIVFSGDPNRALVDESLQAGACGYIWKQSAADELLRAVEIVMTGKLYLSPEVSMDILEDYRRGLTGETEVSKPLLSERDKLVLRLVAEGRRNKEIALQMTLSIKSVEAYRSRLMKKLGCSNSAELVRYAIREGIATA
jgi:two-component system, NarL family, response regulator NreC